MAFPGYTAESIDKIKAQKRRTHQQQVKDAKKRQTELQGAIEDLQKQLNQADMELQVVGGEYERARRVQDDEVRRIKGDRDNSMEAQEPHGVLDSKDGILGHEIVLKGAPGGDRRLADGGRGAGSDGDHGSGNANFDDYEK